MTLFFVTLLLVFVYLPIDVELPASLFAWMFSGVLLAAIYSVRVRRRWRLISVGPSERIVTLSWGATLLGCASDLAELSAFGVSALFVIYTMIMIVMPSCRSGSSRFIRFQRPYPCTC